MTLIGPVSLMAATKSAFSLLDIVNIRYRARARTSACVYARYTYAEAAADAALRGSRVSAHVYTRKLYTCTRVNVRVRFSIRSSFPYLFLRVDGVRLRASTGACPCVRARARVCACVCVSIYVRIRIDW